MDRGWVSTKARVKAFSRVCALPYPQQRRALVSLVFLHIRKEIISVRLSEGSGVNCISAKNPAHRENCDGLGTISAIDTKEAPRDVVFFSRLRAAILHT